MKDPNHPAENEEPAVTLISVRRSTGSGVIVEYGYLQEFAFDLPTALRRLADRIEGGQPEARQP